MKSPATKNQPELRSAFDLLTPAQRRVFHCILRGLTAAEIGSELGLAVYTVANHTREIFRAFDVRSRGALLANFVVDPFLDDNVRDSTSALEKAISRFEGFNVKITSRVPLAPKLYANKFARQARNTFTVGQWIEGRLRALYPDAEVQVLHRDGRPAKANVTLQRLREG